MKYLTFSTLLIILAFGCKKNDPVSTKKTRLKSFTFHQSASSNGFVDSTIIQYSGDKVSHIRMITKTNVKVTSINDYALTYDNEKLVSCAHTFEILDYYPKGIQFKSDENNQLTMISSGTDFILFYDYINKTQVRTLYKSSRNNLLETYEFNSENNLTLVNGSSNTPTQKYEYNKVMNPFNDFNLPAKPLLTFLSGPFQISSRFTTASKNTPISFSGYPFTTVSSFKQKLNSQGQLIEAIIPTSSTNSWIHRFYYE